MGISLPLALKSPATITTDLTSVHVTCLTSLHAGGQIIFVGEETGHPDTIAHGTVAATSITNNLPSSGHVCCRPGTSDSILGPFDSGKKVSIWTPNSNLSIPAALRNQ